MQQVIRAAGTALLLSLPVAAYAHHEVASAVTGEAVFTLGAALAIAVAVLLARPRL